VLREGDWLDDYTTDAEKFTPPSAESTENMIKHLIL